MRSTARASSATSARAPRSATRALRLPGVCAIFLVAGCATVDYEPAPVDAVAILREMRAAGAPSHAVDGQSGASLADPSSAPLTMDRAAAFAVARNPQLQVMRAEVGVSRAKLVEAGLLPDPSIGWDAMDVLSNQWVNGTTDQENFVAGFGLSWRVPRPGEISAQEALATAELEGSEWAVVRAEWALAHDVADAWLALVSARTRLDVANELLQLGRETSSVLDRARTARAATGLEANLAAIDLADLELERLALEDEAVAARQRLSALLGLAPDAAYEVADAGAILEEPTESLDAASIVDAAIAQRPDLAELMAQYAAAEAELQLEVVRQFPEFSIGTGIELVLPLFSKWNGPAIDRAFAQRAVVRRAVASEISRLRADVHASVAAYRAARRQVDFIAENVEPRLDESLRLTAASLSARELSTLELLLAQRQILDVRMRALTARFEAASSRIGVQAASGRLFGIGNRNGSNSTDETGENE